jgi:hypothetical protein
MLSKQIVTIDEANAQKKKQRAEKARITREKNKTKAKAKEDFVETKEDFDDHKDDLTSPRLDPSPKATRLVKAMDVANIADITTFFTPNHRDKNDATNKIREGILKVISHPPATYLEDAVHGNSWRTLHHAWHAALRQIAQEKGIHPSYTSTQIEIKGGRRFNYDADVSYRKGNVELERIKIEFKNGGSTICDQPQFLSLQAKFPLFPVTYDTFWYENYLDRYIACDSELTEAKPALPLYLKHVTSTKYSITPFFNQLKARETLFQKEKNAVVNASITEYLTQHGKDINLALFAEKVKATQTDKIYMMWNTSASPSGTGQFNIDMMPENDSVAEYHSIKNGNVLQVKSGNTMYELLLRWRNHKGILNPAWQISMKRLL